LFLLGSTFADVHATWYRPGGNRSKLGASTSSTLKPRAVLLVLSSFVQSDIAILAALLRGAYPPRVAGGP
jgi:hypothetical protein